MDSYTEKLYQDNMRLKLALKNILKVLRVNNNRKIGMKKEIRDIIYKELLNKV